MDIVLKNIIDEEIRRIETDHHLASDLELKRKHNPIHLIVHDFTHFSECFVLKSCAKRNAVDFMSHANRVFVKPGCFLMGRITRGAH